MEMLVKMTTVLVKIAVMMMAPDGVLAPPEARGRTSPPLSWWHRSAIERGIAAVIVFINITIITILISFTRSTLPHPAVIPT